MNLVVLGLCFLFCVSQAQQIFFPPSIDFINAGSVSFTIQYAGQSYSGTGNAAYNASQNFKASPSLFFAHVKTGKYDMQMWGKMGQLMASSLRLAGSSSTTLVSVCPLRNAAAAFPAALGCKMVLLGANLAASLEAVRLARVNVKQSFRRATSRHQFLLRASSKGNLMSSPSRLVRSNLHRRPFQFTTRTRGANRPP